MAHRCGAFAVAELLPRRLPAHFAISLDKSEYEYKVSFLTQVQTGEINWQEKKQQPKRQ